MTQGILKNQKENLVNNQGAAVTLITKETYVTWITKETYFKSPLITKETPLHE